MDQFVIVSIKVVVSTNSSSSS